MNQARRENPALHADWRLHFHNVDNDHLLCYSKTTADFSNVILVVVNLDPDHTHAGWVDLDLAVLGLDREHPYQVHELLGDSRYLWSGARNYVELIPQTAPAHSVSDPAQNPDRAGLRLLPRNAGDPMATLSLTEFDLHLLAEGKHQRSYRKAWRAFPRSRWRSWCSVRRLGS